MMRKLRQWLACRAGRHDWVQGDKVAIPAPEGYSRAVIRTKRCSLCGDEVRTTEYYAGKLWLPEGELYYRPKDWVPTGGGTYTVDNDKPEQRAGEGI